MQFSISVVSGLAVGAVLLVALGHGLSAKGPGITGPTRLGWTACGAGVLALAAGVLMMSGSRPFPSAPVSIGLAVTAMVVSIGAAVRGDRHWPTWVGLGAGLAPTLFWILFVAGELVSPH